MIQKRDIVIPINPSGHMCLTKFRYVIFSLFFLPEKSKSKYNILILEKSFYTWQQRIESFLDRPAKVLEKDFYCLLLVSPHIYFFQ